MDIILLQAEYNNVNATRLINISMELIWIDAQDERTICYILA